MSEYTEEDFKNAKFAEHTDGRIAMRAEPETGVPWYVGDDQIKRLDVAMARDGWRPVHEAPLTLDALREAWETAESLEAYRSIISEGDVLIIKEPHDIYLVRPAYEEVLVGRADAENVRVLYRSPRPWQVLADVLGGVMLLDGVTPGRVRGIAQNLYERGVRVTGSDET